MARFGAARGRVRAFWLIAALLALGVEFAAACSGGDATWDFRNYHLYNAFALLNKPFGVDIAPAHMQTFFSPTMDLLYYGLARSIPWTPLLNAVMAIPHALAIGLTFALSCRLLQPRSLVEQVTIGVFVAISATGVAGGLTIATTMSEMLPAGLVLLGVALIIPRDLRTPPSLRRMLLAGLAVGLACGLKLTMSYATIALALALVVIPRRSLAELATRPAVFGIGVVVGTAALSGYWWAHQWSHYGNPFFPLMNDIFRSSLAAPDSFVDRTFLPRSLAEALSAPWSWALRLSWATSESRLRDPRFSLGLIAAVICLAQAGLAKPRWRPWPFVFLAGWFIIGFALWRVEFSIYRYLSVLELFSGTMMALAAVPLARQLEIPKLLAAGSVALLAACLFITVYPQLNRTPPGTPPLSADLGKLPPNSMVLLLDNEPMAYLAALTDPAVRFIGTNDFFMTLDGGNPMQSQVEAAIKGHAGPLFGLDSPPEQRDRSQRTLERYGLVRGPCRDVESAISPLRIRLCRLQRRSNAAASN